MTASSSSSLTIDSCMHGFHEYCLIWDPVAEELQCERELENDHDVYAVSVVK